VGGYANIHLSIEGMFCDSCVRHIQAALLELSGVASADVSLNTKSAIIKYDETIISCEHISKLAIKTIGDLGYEAKVGAKYDTIAAINLLAKAKATTSLNKDKAQKNIGSKHRSSLVRTTAILLIIIALYTLLSISGLLNMLVPGELANTSMSYMMIFVVGVLTSVHCVAMCGGINISQSLHGSKENNKAKTNKKTVADSLVPALLYNIGRIASYTAIGFILGMVGYIIGGGFDSDIAMPIPVSVQGILKLLAGLIMIIMGIKMLGLFPRLLTCIGSLLPKTPKWIKQRFFVKESHGAYGKSPLIVGLLNGLMPCGPMQAMQIIALASANPLNGALAMLLFSLGTVPAMLGLGSLVSLLGMRFRQRVLLVGSTLVVVLGIAMFVQGGTLAGIQIRLPDDLMGNTSDNVLAANNVVLANRAVLATDGTQEISSVLEPGRYPDITVVIGVPVRWTIDAPQGSINGCNNRLIVQEYGLEYSFKQGKNVIEFTPNRAGTINYSCWMGMITGTINVI
jgi:sulfite exporter TauE/SafE/copper chaperone CopZ